MDPQPPHSPTPNPPVEPSTPEKDQAKINDTEEILRQCAEARQATRDREKAREHQQRVIHAYTQMRAQWAQLPVRQVFQGPSPAQHFSHQTEQFAHPSAIRRPPPQSFLGGPTQSSFDIYPPPPPDVMARCYSDPVNGTAPGFGNYPPSSSGFNPQSAFNGPPQHDFHQVPQPFGFNNISQPAFHHGPLPGFPPGPRTQKVDHPGHHRRRPPHQQASGPAGMHKSFSAPTQMDPALSSGPKSTTAPTPTVSGKAVAANSGPSPGLLDPALWTSAANSTAHKSNGQFHSDATQKSLSVPPAVLQKAGPNNPNGVQPQSSKAPSGSPLVFANEEELLNWDLLELGQVTVPIVTLPNGRTLILPNAWLDGNQWVPNSQPVPCLYRWMVYFNRFIGPTTNAPPHPDAFSWDGESRPWGNGRTFRDTCQRAWFEEAGIDPDTHWPSEQPRQTAVTKAGSQQEQISETQAGDAQQGQVTENQSGDASSSAEQNAYEILPPDVEQDIASFLNLSD